MVMDPVDHTTDYHPLTPRIVCPAPRGWPRQWQRVSSELRLTHRREMEAQVRSGAGMGVSVSYLWEIKGRTSNMKSLFNFLFKLVAKKQSKSRRKKILSKLEENVNFNRPTFTSTPPSFKISPLNQYEHKYSSDSDDDFRIYDIYDPQDTFSGQSSTLSRSHCSSEALYENLEAWMRPREEQVFEDIIFANSLQMNRIHSEDLYEMISSPRSRIRTRTLKGRNTYSLKMYLWYCKTLLK